MFTESFFRHEAALSQRGQPLAFWIRQLAYIFQLSFCIVNLEKGDKIIIFRSQLIVLMNELVKTCVNENFCGPHSVKKSPLGLVFGLLCLVQKIVYPVVSEPKNELIRSLDTAFSQICAIFKADKFSLNKTFIFQIHVFKHVQSMIFILF